jgi:hypothetical protein
MPPVATANDVTVTPSGHGRWCIEFTNAHGTLVRRTLQAYNPRAARQQAARLAGVPTDEVGVLP